MLRKKVTLVLSFVLLTVINANAKIWRVNNTPGVPADFTTFNAAATSSSVLADDTIHLEPSATSYATGSFNLTKRLVVIGVGYFLDPANTTTPGNAGLQATTLSSSVDFFYILNGANGSRFIGITFTSSGIYINASPTPYNLSFEKCLFSGGGIYFANAGNYDGITVRKCFFNSSRITSQGATSLISNFICENSIFNASSWIDLPGLTGTGNIVRNNSVIGNFGNAFTLANTYVANNIFGIPAQSNFTNCVIKNNLFQFNQTLPPTATNNQVSVNMANVYVGGTTGSLDSRAALRSGSPAIGAGLTVGAVTSPDCGAFGATDPYKLSGIPNIPSIYTLTVPVSIPAGTPSMNVTISTRNNN